MAKAKTRTQAVGDGDAKVTIYWPSTQGGPFRVRWTNPDGSRGEAKRRTEADARAVQLEVHEELLHPERQSDVALTVAELAGMFIDARQGRRAEGTMKNYRSKISKWVLPTIGAMRCVDVTPFVVQTLVIDKAAEVNEPSTVATLRDSVLSPLFGFGRDNVPDLSTWAPLHGVEVPTVNLTQQDAMFIPMTQRPTTQQVSLIADLFESQDRHDVSLLVLVMAHMGLRLGEALALRTIDLDFQAGRCEVRRQLTGREIKPFAKGGKHRQTFIPGFMLDRLEARVAEVGGGDRWLFPSLKVVGRPMSQENFRDHFWAQARPLLGGIKYDTPHGLRHHFGTWCLAPVEDGGLGLTTMEVCFLMGHSSPSITERTYLEVHGGLFEKLATRTSHSTRPRFPTNLRSV